MGMGRHLATNIWKMLQYLRHPVPEASNRMSKRRLDQYEGCSMVWVLTSSNQISKNMFVLRLESTLFRFEEDRWMTENFESRDKNRAKNILNDLWWINSLTLLLAAEEA